jgi:hypothetical protein
VVVLVALAHQSLRTRRAREPASADAAAAEPARAQG